jgi:hypothetical protein
VRKALNECEAQRAAGSRQRVALVLVSRERRAYTHAGLSVLDEPSCPRT